MFSTNFVSPWLLKIKEKHISFARKLAVVLVVLNALFITTNLVKKENQTKFDDDKFKKSKFSYLLMYIKNCFIRSLSRHLCLESLKLSREQYKKLFPRNRSKISNFLYKYVKLGGAILWKYALFLISYPIFFFRNIRKFNSMERFLGLLIVALCLYLIAGCIFPPLFGGLAIIPFMTHGLTAASSIFCHPLTGSITAFLYDTASYASAIIVGILAAPAAWVALSFLCNIPNFFTGFYRNITALFSSIYSFFTNCMRDDSYKINYHFYNIEVNLNSVDNSKTNNKGDDINNQSNRTIFASNKASVFTNNNINDKTVDDQQEERYYSSSSSSLSS